MTEVQPEVTEPAVAEPVMRGRFAVYATEEGRLKAVAYATPLCERCVSCGCGEQQDPLTMQSMIAMAMDAAKGHGPATKLLGMLGRMAGHG